MPRRVNGLSGSPGSRIPLRGFSGLLKNLEPGVRNQLESAFVDAERLGDSYLITTPERQNKRRASGLIQKLHPTVENTLLGALISWNRLDDPAISFYEMQLSDSNTFNSFDTVQVLEQFIVLENLTSIKFARVRGVRSGDGETGLWSDTLTVSPTTTAAEAFSFEFYQEYTGEKPKLKKKRTYGMTKSHQEFYTIFSKSFYADLTAGGVSVWGNVSNRLTRDRSSGVTPWDRLRWRINGISYMDGYFPHWVSRYDYRVWNKNEFYDSDPKNVTSPMTFYGLGGYTAAFGPYTVTVPNVINGVGPNDPNRVRRSETADSAFYWTDVDNGKFPSNFEQGQLRGYNDLNPAHETHSLGIRPGQKTEWLVFQDFKFNVPAGRTITGIKAELKRRQLPKNDVISANLGVRRPDKADGDDLCLEYKDPTMVGSPSTSGFLEPRFIKEDVNFGKYLDKTCERTTLLGRRDSGQLSSDNSGIGDDGVFQKEVDLGFNTLITGLGSASRLFDNNSFSISCWYRLGIPMINGGPQAGVLARLFEAETKGISSSLIPYNEDPQQVFPKRGNIEFGFIPLTVNPATNTMRYANFILTMTDCSTSARSKTVNNVIATNDQASNPYIFHNLVITYNHPTDSLRVYIDGINRTLIIGGAFRSEDWDSRRRCLGVGNSARSNGGQIGWSGDVAQYGIWNKALTQDEAVAIFKAKGRADLTSPFGDYVSNKELNHYFLYFPDQADVRDESVVLVDSTGFRTDLDDKVIGDESWPHLGQFFYTDERQYGFLPLAVSDGIPHDNHLAIGYQDYGGLGDLWGAPSWTPDQVNDFYFGFAIRANNQSTSEFNGSAFVDHGRMTVYYAPESDDEINITVEAAATNQFYYERECFGALFNVLEIGAH